MAEPGHPTHEIIRSFGVVGVRMWAEDIWAIVKRLPRDFTLSEVYSHKDDLARAHPTNRNIEAKIRQQLQLLRDTGKLEFVDYRGNYQRRSE